MENKLVTAIITTHNRKNLLMSAISSVQKQTYKPLELIVVDDASSDGTGAVLERLSKQYKFKYIYISKEESKGGNYARNKGIMEASGEYIGFLDDDDEWFPDKIEKQVAYIRDNPECGAVGCGRVIEDNHGKKIKQDLSSRLEGELSEKVFTGTVLLSSEVLVKKKLIVDIGLFDENLKYWQDYELTIRLLQRTQLGIVREYLVLYRDMRSDKNRLTNNIAGWEEAVRYIHEKHKELLKALSPEMKRQHRLFVLYDAVERAKRIGDRKLKQMYLKKVYEIEPTMKNWVKYKFNVNNVKFVHWISPSIKTKIHGGGRV